ncbi:MAG: UDP-glucose 4-epimerase GalE [Geminicoccaceae bacterium]
MVRSVLVTGGAGYIGSHVCQALARRGDRPVVLDNLSRGHAQAVRFGPLEVGDIGDDAFVRRVIRKHDVDAVIHMAAFAYVGESVEQPELYFRNNVIGSLRLFDAVLETAVRDVVFSSTCAVYGVPDRLPITEDVQPSPLNPYGDTKFTVERALGALGRAHGLRWMGLRYFNAAGADPDGDLGESHDPETHLIPLALEAAATGRPLTIFGTDYDTADGTAVRDYVHVSDLAAAHLLALDYLRAGGPSGVVNLGTGSGHSVREIIDGIERLAGTPVPTVNAPRRPGDGPLLVADPSLARRLLGWRPVNSDLSTILSTAWNWLHRTAPVPTPEKRPAISA